MKKLLIILLVLLVLAGAVFAFWYLKPEEVVLVDTSPITFPIADPNTTTETPRSSISIPGQSGELVVNDFLKSADTHEDSVNPGYYYLKYLPPEIGTEDTSPYHILYISETSYFNVVINQEPIGEVRKQAEAHLMSALSISQADMCNLVYTVGVPNTVNSTYSGKSLGFSFCPGAVLLP